MLGGVAGLGLGPALLDLVRERLRIGCDLGGPGAEGEGSWICADGVGYLGVAVVLGGMCVLLTVLGVLWRGRSRRLVLTVLAATSVLWTLGWTWYGSARLVGAPDDVGTSRWFAQVGPAGAVACAGLALAFVALRVTGRLGVALAVVAPVLALAATVLQPGLGMATLPAAGLLAAVALPDPPGSVTPRIAGRPR